MSKSDMQTIEKAAELYAVKKQVGTNRKYEYATKLIMRLLAHFQKHDDDLNVPAINDGLLVNQGFELFFILSLQRKGLDTAIIHLVLTHSQSNPLTMKP